MQREMPLDDEHAIQRVSERCFDLVGIVQHERLVYINAAGRALLGVVDDQGNAPGVPVERYVAPEDWPNFKRRLAQALASQQVPVADATLVRSDGRRLTIELALHPIHWRGRAAVHVVGRDITEQRRRETLVQGERRILELVAVGAPLHETLVAITHLVEAQGDGALASILLINDNGNLSVGAAPSLPDWFNESIENQPIGPTVGTCGTAAYRREPVTSADIANDPLWNGHHHWASRAGLAACWSTPLMADNGRVVGTLAHYYRTPKDPTPRDLKLTDIAKHLAEIAIQRCQAETALRHANEDLERRVEERSKDLHASERLLSESQRLAQLGSWSWDVKNDVVHWSDELYRIYGLDPKTFGTTLEAFLGQLRPDQRDAVRLTIQTSLETHAPFSLEERIIRPCGEERILASSGRVEVNNQGLAVRLWGICLDITERQHAEEQRQQSEQRERDALAQVHVAHELNRLKDNFVNSISHDLRTPLTAILGFLEFLEDGLGGPVTSEQMVFIRGVYTNTRRLERLVDDMLDAARFEAGTFALHCRLTDLTEVVNEVLDSLRPQANAAKVDIALAVPGEPAVATLDPQRIEQVIANLLTNALKFTPAGGTIKLSVTLCPERLRFALTDSGPGIALADQPRLFQMFGQLNAGASLGGTGLGLAISKNLIEAHGGEIGVESEPGAGSTFWFELPRALGD